jgi:hypothetical protein
MRRIAAEVADPKWCGGLRWAELADALNVRESDRTFVASVEHGGEAGTAPVAPNDPDAATVIDGLFAIASAIEQAAEAIQHAADAINDSAFKARLS